MSATTAAFSAFLSIFSFFFSVVANKKTSFAHQARRPLSHPARLRWKLSRSVRHQRSLAIQLSRFVSIAAIRRERLASAPILGGGQRALHQHPNRRRTRRLGRGQLDVPDADAGPLQ